MADPVAPPFLGLPDAGSSDPGSSDPCLPEDRERLVEAVRNGVIGRDHVIPGPFGARRVTYADYTASGRSLSFIEDFIRQEVMPLYANTHTESSGTGLQTTRFRKEARQIIAEAVGATDDDVVVFSGSGATGAINKLIDCMNLRLPSELDARYALLDQIPAEERPVVFVGPFEHHSNELPWRESICDVVTIEEDSDGRASLAHLEAMLQRYVDRPLKIGSFSAASNVTGIGSDTAGVSTLLHRYGALSFWDFAAAGPYVEIEMNMQGEGEHGALAYKDAVFLSPHKFIGGPGTPGVLVAKRALFENKVPAWPGGGTVAYVNATEHRYLEDIEHREEGGTPAIIESIRAGLVFQLKEAVGVDTIQAREHAFIRRAIGAWRENPAIRILGNPDAWRLSIVSFVIQHGQQRLHHNFVVAVLNDLFGIQSRGGCSCAGPYGHRLLGIDLDTSKDLEHEILAGCEGIKPGWVRVNFNYFISDATFRYVIEAVNFVAQHGWKLLPLYAFDPQSGLWRHREGRPEPTTSLMDISYELGTMEYSSRHAREPERVLRQYLDAARQLVAELEARSDGLDAAAPGSAGTPDLDREFERLRWFPLPADVLDELRRR